MALRLCSWSVSIAAICCAACAPPPATLPLAPSEPTVADPNAALAAIEQLLTAGLPRMRVAG